MTGQAFLTLFLKLTDKNSSDTTYKDLALEWFNLVIKDIQNRQDDFHWRFLEKTATAPTAVNQFNYELPSDIDILKIVHVYDKTNDRTYTFVPYERFKASVADETNQTGDQFIFTLWAEELLLYPVPDAIITIYMDYVRLLTALADDSNSTEIPARYDTVLIDGALVWAYKFDPELGDWKAQQAIYQDGIDRMKTENRVIITENVRPLSHRNKGFDRAFPLAQDNM